jgi:hypothetical protein
MNYVNSVKQITHYEGYDKLFCIDQSMSELNPSGTFKDKQPQALDTLLQNNTTQITIGAMSTGNTAYSVLKFALDYNNQHGKLITPVIYLPLGLETKSYFGPDTENNLISGKEYFRILEEMAQKSGGKLVWLDFGTPGKKSPEDYLSSLRLARVAQKEGLLADNSKFINITEGLERTTFLSKKQVDTLSEEEYLRLPKLGIKAYQPIIIKGLEDLKRNHGLVPDYLICQFGAGILFNEIKDYIQESGLKTKIIPVAVGDPESCADKIYPSYWTEDPSKLRGGGITFSRHDNSIVYGVEDWELGRSLEALSGQLNAEASGVAGFSLLYRLEDIIPELNRKKDVVLTINTGNGIPNFMVRK